MKKNSSISHYTHETGIPNTDDVCAILYTEIIDKSDNVSNETIYEFEPNGQITIQRQEVLQVKVKNGNIYTETRVNRFINKMEYQIPSVDMDEFYKRICDCANSIIGCPIREETLHGYIRIIRSNSQCNRISRFAYSIKECIYDPVSDMILRIIDS